MQYTYFVTASLVLNHTCPSFNSSCSRFRHSSESVLHRNKMYSTKFADFVSEYSEKSMKLPNRKKSRISLRPAMFLLTLSMCFLLLHLMNSSDTPTYSKKNARLAIVTFTT